MYSHCHKPLCITEMIEKTNQRNKKGSDLLKGWFSSILAASVRQAIPTISSSLLFLKYPLLKKRSKRLTPRNVVSFWNSLLADSCF